MTETEPRDGGPDQPLGPNSGPKPRRSRRRHPPESDETIALEAVAGESLPVAPDEEAAPADVEPARPKRRRRKTRDDAAAGAAGPTDAGDEPQPATEPLVEAEKPWRIRLGFARPRPSDEPGALSPRRALFRDTSVLLMVIALLVLAVGQPSEKLAAQDDDIRGAVATNGTIPAGTLDLLNPTTEPTLGPEDTARPTFTVGRATLPPWMLATPTPTPKPKPKPKPTPEPTAEPTCDPLVTPDPADPLATPCPEPTLPPTPPPTEIPTEVPTASSEPSGGASETPAP